MLAFPATSFVNRMAEPAPRRDSPPRVKWILWGLLLACFVPRALMAAHLDIICADGAFFVELAQQIDRDQPTEAVGQYDANLFPLILILLHDAGFRWDEGGTWWGVICGSLAVLPLFGWLRRQFNDRLAVLSCLLFAAHPKLIEWSPEIVREPTFWLLLTSSLYFTHRAFSEVKLRWFFAAGATTTLAVATRFEGWFLLGGIAIWGLQRTLSLRIARPKLVAGFVCFAACLPVCAEGMRRGYGYDHWPLGNSQRLRLVHEFFESLVARHSTKERREPHAAADSSPPISLVAWQQPAVEETSAATKHTAAEQEQTANAKSQLAETEQQSRSPTSVTAEQVPLGNSPPNEIHIVSPERSARKTIWVFAHTLERGFTPVFGILLGLGYLGYWRLQLRADLIPMFLWSLVTLCGMWIHLWAAQESSSRYATSIVTLATPFAALGVCNVASLLQFIVWKIRASWKFAPVPLLACLLVVFTGVGWVDALTSGYEGRAARVDLGMWIEDRYGRGTIMLGSHRWSQANHYARGQYYTLPAIDCSLQEIDELIERLDPRIIVLSGTEMTPEQWELVADHCAPHGFVRLPDDTLPKLCRAKISVLHRNPSPRVARGGEGEW